MAYAVDTKHSFESFLKQCLLKTYLHFSLRGVAKYPEYITGLLNVSVVSQIKRQLTAVHHMLHANSLLPLYLQHITYTSTASGLCSAAGPCICCQTFMPWRRGVLAGLIHVHYKYPKFPSIKLR